MKRGVGYQYLNLSGWAVWTGDIQYYVKTFFHSHSWAIGTSRVEPRATAECPTVVPMPIIWSGMSLSTTVETSWSKVLVETPEGMKEGAEKEWGSQALMNEGEWPDKWKGAHVWSHMFGGGGSLIF